MIEDPNNRLPLAKAVKQTALGFTDGFGCLFKGLKLVYVDHRELAKIYLLPMAVAIVLLVGGWVLFGQYVDGLIAALWSEPNPDSWWGIAHFFWSALSVLAWIIFAAISIVIVVSTFSLIAAPFSDLLSERIEGIQGTWNPQPFSWRFLAKDILQTVLLELVRLGIKAAWLLPLLVLSWVIPVVGQLVYTVLGGYLLAKFIGMDYMDWCMARRGWTFKERLAFIRRHRWATVGLGTAVLLALMIPLAFAVVWPAAVAGGAILFGKIGSDPDSNRG